MHQQLWYESTRHPGMRLALHWWKNTQKTEVPMRGYVWVLHGMGEHGARYAEVATFLTGLGFDVLAPDLPGYGLTRTEGNAKVPLTIPDTCEELGDLLNFWVRKGPVSARGLTHAPWFLLGHSQGALTALAWILRGKKGDHEVEFAQRAFVSAPPLKLRLAVPAWKSTAARLLGEYLPNIKIANGITPDDLSYDVANVASYRADPLVHDEATPRGYLSMVSTAVDVLARPQDVEIPVCLAVGADDPIVDPATIRGYFESLGTHKKFLEFPKMKHEILNEVGRAACFDAVAAWFL